MKHFLWLLWIVGSLAGCERDEFGSRDSGGSIGLPTQGEQDGDQFESENNTESPALNNDASPLNNANSPDPDAPTSEPDYGVGGAEMLAAIEAVTRATFTDASVLPGNVVFSPVGLVTTLVVAGHGGDARTQEAVAARLASDNFGEIGRGISAFVASKRSEELWWFPTMWVATDTPLADDFVRTVFPDLLEDVRTVDFSTAESARQTINNYYRTETDGVITSAIGPLGLEDGQQAALVDAVYFQGKWLNSFDTGLTAEGVFYSESGPVSTAFMEQTHEFLVHRAADFRAVELPYHNGFSLTVVVPDSEAALARIQGEFSVQFLWDLSQLSANERVRLRMPRIDVEGRLEAGLFGVAVADAASREDGLAGAGAVGGAALVQRAVVSFDEAGTTGIVTNDGVEAVGEEVPDFLIDRPFLFAVRDNASGVVVLAGRVLNP